MARLPFDTFLQPLPPDPSTSDAPMQLGDLWPSQELINSLGGCRDRLASTRVAIVGGGFAGLMAGWFLRWFGVSVTIFEAQQYVGGRVLSDWAFVHPKVVEDGAELIGSNHLLWRTLATSFGLTLVPVTTDYGGLRERTWFEGRQLTKAEEDQIEAELLPVLTTLGAEAAPIDPMRPWESPNAAAYDGISVAQRLGELAVHVGVDAGGIGIRYLSFVLGNDNAVDTTNQSYLALLALVSGGRMGGDMLGYWKYTETHRCQGGNTFLAQRLAVGADARVNVPIRRIAVDENGVTIGADASEDRFHFAVLTAPPQAWGQMTISSTTEAWDPRTRAMFHGPAVKFMRSYPTPAWAPAGLAPSAHWDGLGQVWEGTDRQEGIAGPFCLSVFSGGRYIPANPEVPRAPEISETQAEMSRRLSQLYPDLPSSAEQLIDWRESPWCGPGYAMPCPGQVTTVAPWLHVPFGGRLYFAGEQSCVGWVGYMEGALRSGARAARDLVYALCASGQDDGPVSESWSPGGQA